RTTAYAEIAKGTSARVGRTPATGSETVHAIGKSRNGTIPDRGAMGGKDDLNAVATAAAGPGDLEAIQIQSHALGIDLDAVCLGYTEVGREIIRARLVDDEVVAGVAGVYAGGRGRGLEIDAR